MDIQAIWIVLVAIASPVVGVVAFLIQLRQLRMTHLQLQKLALEVEALKKQAEEKDRRLVPVTTAEVKMYGEAVFQRDRNGEGPVFSRIESNRSVQYTQRLKQLGDWLLTAVVVVVVVAFVVNAVDILISLWRRLAS